MDYLQLIPVELLEIVISYLEYKSIKSFIDIVPYPKLINWTTIYSYYFGTFGTYLNINKDIYFKYLGIESLKNKLPKSYLSAKSIEEIYNLSNLDLSYNELSMVPTEISI